MKQVRKSLSCALMGNYAVITGTENGIEAEIELLLLDDGIPVNSIKGTCT